MQRTSDSIATLAAALARAQIELVNPEKSLVATIRSDSPKGAEHNFRYASLASGLDIVRKILGRHEIATVQTTSIDQAGIINLTTVLAHASGEWIASDWPVCQVSETAMPHRMGAALTYARRYALFTLVGIAGEDDLDAPDLVTPTNQTSGPQKPKANSNGQLNAARTNTLPRMAPQITPRVSKVILGPEASAELRDRLVAELNGLGSSDDAATWAQRSLREKNRLTAADAQHLEDAFQMKLGLLASGSNSAIEAADDPLKRSTLHKRRVPKLHARQCVKPAIDKSTLIRSEPRRIRDREHVKFVAQQPCLICGRRPSDAHHLRFTQSRALGRKVSDEFTVPLCRGHHREVHRCGDEVAWWNTVGIDPTNTARALWLETHPLAAGDESAYDTESRRGAESPKQMVT